MLAPAALSRRSYSDRSYRVFTTRRRVRFVESEYAIPAATAPGVLDTNLDAVFKGRSPRKSLWPSDFGEIGESGRFSISQKISILYGFQVENVAINRQVELCGRQFIKRGICT